jgi:hypothetical protein
VADDFEQYAEQPDDEFEQFAEKSAAPEVGAPEAAFLGAGDVATGGLMDKMLGGFAAADAATQMAHGLKSPEDAEKTYREVVPEAQARREAAFEQHPTPYRVGEGAGFLGTGGAQLIKGMFGLGKAAPAALRSLGTAEGWKAAAMGAAKGGAIGGAYGAAGGAGHSDAPDWYGLLADTAKGAGAGMASGALIGAPMGVGGAALENEAGRATERAAAGRTMEAADAATEEHARRLAQQNLQYEADVHQAAAGRNSLEEAGKAKYEGELAQAKSARDAQAGQYDSDVREAASAKAAKVGESEAKYTKELSAVEKAQQEAEAAALAKSREPTRDKTLKLLALEGKQNKIGGPEDASELQTLFDEPVDSGSPESARVMDQILKTTGDPKKGIELVRGLKEDAGRTLGTIREQLAATGTKVDVRPVIAEMDNAFGALPAEVREQAVRQANELVLQNAKDGLIDAGRLRQAIENMKLPSRYGTTMSSGTAVAETAPVYRKARGLLLGLEKQAIQEKLPPESLGVYDQALRRYGLFSDAEIGAVEKLRRVQAGKPEINYPKPERVELPRPEKPGPAVYDAKVAEPAEIPLPEKPGPATYGAKVAKPGELPEPARPTNEAELLKLLEPKLTLGGKVARSVAGMGGRMIGGELGAMGAKAAVENWLKAVAPSADVLSANAQVAGDRLAKWAPVFEKAMKEGPRAVALIHSVLLAQNPDYRDALKSQQVNVTAHEETDVAAAPPAEKPAAPASPDIVSSPEMDALALEHFRRNPQKAHAWSETGWLMQKNNPDDPERNAMSAPIHGEETEVPFRWTPSKDHVTATVHTHPNKMGARDLNQKNRSASSRDSDLVTKGHVPAYILGTDLKLRVSELRNGKVVERLLDGQD